MKTEEQIKSYIQSAKENPEFLNELLKDKSPVEIFISALEFSLKPEEKFRDPREEEVNSCVKAFPEYEDAIRYLYANASGNIKVRKQCLQKFMDIAKARKERESAAWHVYRQCSLTLPDVGLRLYSTDGNYRVI